jgi:hypothetical protein
MNGNLCIDDWRLSEHGDYFTRETVNFFPMQFGFTRPNAVAGRIELVSTPVIPRAGSASLVSATLADLHGIGDSNPFGPIAFNANKSRRSSVFFFEDIPIVKIFRLSKCQHVQTFSARRAFS